jgi:hypothetical protein
MTANWFRTPIPLRCGSCGERIAALMPARRLQTGRVRCPACAKRLLDEDEPRDLGTGEERSPVPRQPSLPVEKAPSFLQPFVERARRWLDGKQRQSGDDAA